MQLCVFTEYSFHYNMKIQNMHVSKHKNIFAYEFDDEFSFIQSFSDSGSECDASIDNGSQDQYQYGPSYFSALAEDDITIGTSQTDNTFYTYHTDFSDFSEYTEQTGMTDYSDTSSITGKSTLTGMSRKSKRKAELARRIAQEMKSLSIEELKMLIKSGKMMKHRPELETLAEEDSFTEDDGPSVVESSYSTENELHLDKSTDEYSASEYDRSSDEGDSMISRDDRVSTRTFSGDQNEVSQSYSGDQNEVSQSYSDEPTVGYSTSYSEDQRSYVTEAHDDNGFLSLFKFKAPPRSSSHKAKRRCSYNNSSYENETHSFASESMFESYTESYSESYYTEEEELNDEKDMADSGLGKSDDNMAYMSSEMKSNEAFYSAVSSNESSDYRSRRRERDRSDTLLDLGAFKYNGYEEDAIITPRHCNVSKTDKVFQNDRNVKSTFGSWYDYDSESNVIQVEIESYHPNDEEVVEICLVESCKNVRKEQGIDSHQSIVNTPEYSFMDNIKSISSIKQAKLGLVHSMESNHNEKKSCSSSSKPTERERDPVEEFRTLRSDSGLSYEGDDSVGCSYDKEYCNSFQDESVCMEDIMELVREKKLEMEKACDDIHSDDDLDYESDTEPASNGIRTILVEYISQSAKSKKDDQSEDPVSYLETSSVDLIGMKDLMSHASEKDRSDQSKSTTDFHMESMCIMYNKGPLENENKHHLPPRKNDKSKVLDTFNRTHSVDLIGKKNVVSGTQDRWSPTFRTDISLDSMSRRESKPQLSLEKNDSIADSDSLKISTSVDLIGIKDLMKHIDNQNSSEVTTHYPPVQMDDFLHMKPVTQESAEESSVIQDDTENINIEEDDDDIYGINHLVQLVKGQKV